MRKHNPGTEEPPAVRSRCLRKAGSGTQEDSMDSGTERSSSLDGVSPSHTGWGGCMSVSHAYCGVWTACLFTGERKYNTGQARFSDPRR